MHCIRPELCLALASVLGACVMSNPSWDPPSGAQADTGDDSDTEGGFDDVGDLPNGGDGDRGDGDENEGDGDGDPSGDGDGDGEPNGDGDGEPNGDGDGDSGDDVCGNAAPSFGPCPPSCDECYDGVCWRYCGAGECNDEFMLCPVSWSCRFKCIGKDSCKEATLACTGWGTCGVDCIGENACSNADVICASGPCEVVCGGDGDLRPCDHLDVRCGSDVTKVLCEEPYEGTGPSLSENQYNECGCTSDCVPADHDDD